MKKQGLRTLLTASSLSLALLLTPVIGWAADIGRLPVKAPALVPPVPYYNWSGLYFGINGGGGWGSSSHTDANNGIATGDFGVSGGLFGGTIGYNYQAGRWVWGLEGDLDWARITGNSGAFTNGINYNSYLQWISTARGRVGYAFDQFLPYVTGGAAIGDVKGAINTPVSIMTGTNTQAGWTVGAGLEYGVTPNLSVKAEYLYVDLGSITPVPGDNVDLRTHVVRGGVNWRFNWDGPPH